MSSTVRLTAPKPADGSGSIDHPDVTVDVDLAHGGRVAQITVDGIALLAVPPAGAKTADGSLAPTSWGSFPMAPWAGRIRDGTFTHFGSTHQLARNRDDSADRAPGRQHAIHGTVFDVAWTVDAHHDDLPGSAVLELSCRLDQPGSGWPFGGLARQRIEVAPDQLRFDLSVQIDHADPAEPTDPTPAEPTHADPIDPTPADPILLDPARMTAGAVFPASIGWHPWWVKPDALGFDPDAMYERDAIGLPTGRLVAPTEGPWDDCFVNTAPVTLHYERDTVPTVTVSSDCDHWVIYDMPEHATCVEPQSGPPDALTLRPEIVTATRPLRRTMIIGW